MSWDEEIGEMRTRESLASEMGGPEKVARQHEFNKFTIRERIDLISDKGSFHEDVTNKIMDDFIKSCKPKTVTIIGDFNVRGGIKTIVKVNYKKPGKKK